MWKEMVTAYFKSGLLQQQALEGLMKTTKNLSGLTWYLRNTTRKRYRSANFLCGFSLDPEIFRIRECRDCSGLQSWSLLCCFPKAGGTTLVLPSFD